MKCKNENCSGGWIYGDNGALLGRCDCKIDEYRKAYMDWSNIPKSNRKTLGELNTHEIFYNGDTSKPTDYKETIEQLVDMKEDLFKGGRILLKGDKGTGKTQMASTLGIEMFDAIDWNGENLFMNPYILINLNHLMVQNVMFKSTEKELLIKKIRASRILIIDEIGDELNQREDSGQVAMLLDFLKMIVDEFEGLIIMTTNDFNVEDRYKKKRLDIYSRLFGQMEHRDNSLVFGFGFGDHRDLRDTASKSDKLRAFKNQFN